MNILIIEAYTDANIGSGALIENSVKLIKKQFPHADISILAHCPSAVAEFIHLPTYPEVFRLPLGLSRRTQLGWLIMNLTWMWIHFIVRVLSLPISDRVYTFSCERQASLQAIKRSDLCISIGAERINDNFYLALPFSLFTLWMVKSYRKKLVLFPQTIGPFHFNLSTFFAKKVLKKCDRVYARDTRSKSILETMGVSPKKSFFVPDIAIMQEPCEVDTVKEGIFRAEGIPSGSPISGISVMEWSYFKTPPGASNYHEYKRIVAEAVDYLIERYDYHVVFVPTNLKMRGCREDDVKTGDEIFELIRNKAKVTCIRKLYPPGQIKGLIASMDMFIATRMHACIFATSAHVPTLSINYQFKLYEYMKLLGLEDNTVDIEKLTFDKLKELIDYTYANREKIRVQLMQKITDMKGIIREKLVI